MNAERKLSQQVASSAVWQLLKVGCDNVLRFFTFVVLARLLEPADFGVFAIATLFISISATIAAAGLGDVLIREKQLDEELKNTIFWTNLGLNGLLALILLMISPVIAYALANPTIVPVLTVLSMTMLIGPLNFINVTTAVRDFRQREIASRGLAASVTGSVAGITAALSGLGLWALVIQTFAASLTGVVLFNLKFRWRPRFQFSLARLRAILPFSLNILAAQLLQTLIVRLQELIAATNLTMTDVGLYRVGSRFYELICQAFVAPVSGLALPAFSKVRDDASRFSNGYLRMIAVTSLVYCPIMLGFAAVAPDAIPMIFGEKWVPSIPVVQSLALLAPATILAFFHGPALSSFGRSDVLRKITIVQFTGTLIFGLVGVQFGLIGLAVAFVVRSYITLPLQMHWLAEATGLRTRHALATASKPFIAAGLMGCVVYAIQPPLREFVDVAAARLLVDVLLGASLYAAIMFSVFRHFAMTHIGDVLHLVRDMKRAAA